MKGSAAHLKNVTGLSAADVDGTSQDMHTVTMTCTSQLVHHRFPKVFSVSAPPT